MSCQSLNCKWCTQLGSIQKINLRDLILYTPLPELWDVFCRIVTISPLDSQGYLTLTMAEPVIKSLNLNVTHEEFWVAMTEFLSRKNHKILLKKKRENK